MSRLTFSPAPRRPLHAAAASIPCAHPPIPRPQAPATTETLKRRETMSRKPLLMGFALAAALGWTTAAQDATVEEKTVGGKKYNVVTFVGDNKAKVNGYVNEQNLVERVETWIDNPFLGDMPFEAIYSDYKDAGGAQFPMHIVQKQGGYPIFDLHVTDVKANAAVNIQPPQGRGGAPAAAAAPTNPAA